MSALSDMIVALTGVATVGGGAIAWIWVRVEKGFREVKLELRACRLRERTEQERSGLQARIIELLYGHVITLSPDGPPAPAMRRVEALMAQLRDSFKIDRIVPPDMAAMLDQLDRDPAE